MKYEDIHLTQGICCILILCNHDIQVHLENFTTRPGQDVISPTADIFWYYDEYILWIKIQTFGRELRKLIYISVSSKFFAFIIFPFSHVSIFTLLNKK